METFDVAVIGLGFTGLATAVAVARAGFTVVGVDASTERVQDIANARLGNGLSTVSEVELRSVLSDGLLQVRDTAHPQPRARIHVVCVPTPAGNVGGADMTALLGAVDSVAAVVTSGDLVLVQSTCPPGTMDRIIVPRLAGRGGLRPGIDFHVSYSPVRIDPGIRSTTLRTVPRVAAGATPECRRLAGNFLSRFTNHVVPVSTMRAAELVKVFENTFRLVNISLANELAALCLGSDVDALEILDAAGTKPYGFLRHQPGPGAGGDCVPVSAGFFAAAARRQGTSSSIVDAAVAVNDTMPARIVLLLRRLLDHHRMPTLGLHRILVVGVTYKPDVVNTRRSAAIRLLELLRDEAEVDYHDPYVPELQLDDGTVLRSWAVGGHGPDLVLLVTRHSVVTDEALARWGAPVVDCSTGAPHLLERPGMSADQATKESDNVR